MAVRLACRSLAVLLAAGCAPVGPTRPAPATATAEPRSFAVELRNDVAGPFRVDALALAVDGVTLVNRVRPPDRIAIELRRVPAGPHTLQLQVRGSFPCGFGAEPRERVLLRHSWSFASGERAATLRIALVSRGFLPGFGDSLAFDAHLHGAAALAELPVLPASDFSPCAGLDPVPAAVCRLEARLAMAVALRDVVWAHCLDDKLAAARALTDAPDLAQAAQRAAQLEAEADACIGLQLASGWGTFSRRIDACPNAPFEDEVGLAVARTGVEFR